MFIHDKEIAVRPLKSDGPAQSLKPRVSFRTVEDEGFVDFSHGG